MIGSLNLNYLSMYHLYRRQGALQTEDDIEGRGLQDDGLTRSRQTGAAYCYGRYKRDDDFRAPVGAPATRNSAGILGKGWIFAQMVGTWWLRLRLT